MTIHPVKHDTHEAFTRHLPWLLPVLCVLTATLLYFPSLSGDFVYDDGAQLVIDDYVHDFDNFVDIVTLRVLALDVLDQNRPVQLLSLMIDSKIWGRDDPFGYRLSNVIMHGICTLLVYALLMTILPRLTPEASRMRVTIASFAAAILYAVHPANSEAVCVPSFREDVLASLFLLAGWLAAARRTDAGGIGRHVLAIVTIVAMFLAVGAKEVGIIGPPVLVIYWLLVRKQINDARGWWIIILLATAVVGAFLIARFSLEPEHSLVMLEKPRYANKPNSMWVSIQHQPRAWALYLQSVAWPERLLADYPFPIHLPHISLAVGWIVTIVVVLVMIVAGWWIRGVWFAAAVYWLGLLPVSNIVPIYRPIADRYMYVPMIGVAVLLAVLVASIPVRRAGIIVFAAIYAIACVTMMTITLQRESVWHDELSLWTDTLRRNRQSFTAANNIGWAHLDREQYAEALQAFRVTVSTFPYVYDAWGGLALTYETLGYTQFADQAFEQAVRLEPRYADPRSMVRSLTLKPGYVPMYQRIVDRNAELLQRLGIRKASSAS